MGWGKNEVFDFFSAGLNVFIPIPSQAGAIYPEPLVGALANFLIVNSHNHHRYREMMCVVLRRCAAAATVAAVAVAATAAAAAATAATAAAVVA